VGCYVKNLRHRKNLFGPEWRQLFRDFNIAESAA
jgi:hypothetical protein